MSSLSMLPGKTENNKTSRQLPDVHSQKVVQCSSFMILLENSLNSLLAENHLCFTTEAKMQLHK